MQDKSRTIVIYGKSRHDNTIQDNTNSLLNQDKNSNKPRHDKTRQENGRQDTPSPNNTTHTRRDKALQVIQDNN